MPGELDFAAFDDVVASQGDPTALAAVAVGIARGLCHGAELVVAEHRIAELLIPDGQSDRLSAYSVTVSVVSAEPATLGMLHGRLGDASHRRRNGVHYTPDAVAAPLTALVLGSLPANATVCDPACGGGAFLLAAATALVERGARPEHVVSSQLYGADIDELAVAVTRVSLGLWAAALTGRFLAPPPSSCITADSLIMGRPTWPDAVSNGFDAVVGNPPFRSQLSSRTVRSAEAATLVCEHLGLDQAGYVDDAALFLLRSCDLVRPGGRVGLVVPESILAARDAEQIRRLVAEQCRLVELWVGGDAGFDAAVRVWAPVLELGQVHRSDSELALGRFAGRDFDTAGTADPRHFHSGHWASLAADLLGGSTLDVDHDIYSGEGCLGDVASATAGFREQFYGLVPYVVESPDQGADGEVAPLVTAGSIDPLHNRWGRNETRFARRRWSEPVVDLEALHLGDPRLFSWVTDRRVAKVLVAPQTSVLEVISDPTGRLVPSTPVVSVEMLPTSAVSVDHVAALLSSPVASAWAHRHFAGSGLGAGTVRVPARRLLELPFPEDRPAWDRAARWVGVATRASETCDAPAWSEALDELGATMNTAFGLDSDHEVFHWWKQSRPPWR